jgi:membrane protein
MAVDALRLGRLAARRSALRLRFWRDVLIRVKDGISEKNLSLIAAGAAFYAFLSIPAAFSALIALYGLEFDPANVERQVAGLKGVVPDEVIQLLTDQLTNLTLRSTSTLGWGFLLSLAVALWRAQSGSSALISALNQVYAAPDRRSLIEAYGMSLALTLCLILFAIVALVLIAVMPAVIDYLPLGHYDRSLARVLRWPLLMVLVMIALSAIYRFAPTRQAARWRWISWGAVASTLLWIAGSILFSVYVEEFASYDKTYGSLGAVVVLMMWLYVSAFAALIGATLNAEIERQRRLEAETSGR